MENPPRNTERLVDEEIGLGSDPPRRQRASIPSFIFILFLFFMLTNHNEEDVFTRVQYKDAVQALEYQMSNYSSWLNGSVSNFSLPVRDPNLDSLAQTLVPFGHELDPQLGSYYSNTSALFRGDTVFHNLSSSESNVSWHALSDKLMNGTNATVVLERLGSWNWTNTNKVSLKIHDRKVEAANITDEIAVIQGKLELFDPLVTDTVLLDFDGVHFVANGSFYAYADNDGRAPLDVGYIPTLVPDALQNTTARVLEIEMLRRLSKLRDIVDYGVLDDFTKSKDESKRLHKCAFIFYGQLEPTKVPRSLMDELEKETERPTGITTVVPPQMNLNGILISKNCGVLYEFSQAKGLKTWSFNRKVSSYAGVSAILYLILLVLLSRQISSSRTPGGISRLSQWTFLTQGLVDTISFVVLITLAVVVDGRASLSLIAPAALACILFIYEMQFAVLIYRIQVPEDNASQNALASATPAVNQGGTSVSEATPAAAVTQAMPVPPSATPPITTPSRESFWRFFIHHIRTDPQARLWLTMSFILMVMFRIIMVLSVPLFSMMVVYSFIWLPQIIRSAQRGRSGALSNEYLVGTTICRLCFAFYFLAYDGNILDVEPRPWIYSFACWMFFQVAVIVLQEMYGPAFFLPSKLVTAKVYDYHPQLAIPDSESPEQSLGDCSICMDAIVVESLSYPGEKGHVNDSSSGGSGSGFFSVVQRGVVSAAGTKKSYSLAPCHHLFHTSCLERWLAIKNICPQCRRPLPPL